ALATDVGDALSYDSRLGAVSGIDCFRTDAGTSKLGSRGVFSNLLADFLENARWFDAHPGAPSDNAAPLPVWLPGVASSRVLRPAAGSSRTRRGTGVAPVLPHRRQETS